MQVQYFVGFDKTILTINLKASIYSRIGHYCADSD